MDLEDTIKLFSGIQDPTQDLKLTEEQFDELITYYITSVTEWFTMYLNKTYTTLPAGLEQILVEIVSNIFKTQLQRQDLPILDTEDEGNTRTLIDNVITQDILRRLAPYKKKSRIGIFGIGTKTQFNTLMDTLDEDDIDDVV